MIDPRVSIVERRLKDVVNIIAVSGGKGGVGKSITASTLALRLAKKNLKVGLFDLDFTSPSTHLIIGAENVQPKEENGIVPPEIHGMKYMSIVYYSGEEASPLRGADISNALIELLAITRWDSLDYLIIDMPPGISDATLDIIRYVEKVKFLIVTTPSKLAWETVRKMINLLSDLGVPVIGIIENMKISKSDLVSTEAKKYGMKFWGETPFDRDLEANLGNPDSFLATEYGKKMIEIIERNL